MPGDRSLKDLCRVADVYGGYRRAKPHRSGSDVDTQHACRRDEVSL